MKKKKVKIAALSLAALVAGTGAFHAYGSYQQSGESDVLLNENVEALSAGGDGWIETAIDKVISFLPIFGESGESESKKVYRAECNEGCSFYKKVNGHDRLVWGTEKGCEDTEAESPGCSIPEPNPCAQ